VLRREPDGGFTVLGAWSDGPRALEVGARVAAADLPSGVVAPVVRDGVAWGALLAGQHASAPVRGDVRARLAPFGELVARRVESGRSRFGLARLADEQAALGRIALQIADDRVPHDRLLAAVAREVRLLLGVDVVRVRPGGASDAAPDADAPAHHVQVPVVVGGRRWGTIEAGAADPARMPADAEARMATFGELVAMAVAIGEARGQRADLSDEQEALRRIATLVAHDAPADAIFAAVGEELGLLMGSTPTQIVRFDDERTGRVLAGWGDAITPAGNDVTLTGDSVSARVFRTGRPTRISAAEWSGPLGEYALSFGLRWGVGAPILVDGRVWGALTAVTTEDEPFTPASERRLERFAELIAAAIASIEARADLATSRSRLIVAADEERQRVVRDLHDGAQQRLVHAVVLLKLALAELEAGPGRDLVTEALAQSEQATEELRDLARGIMPAVLTDCGLPDAVAMLAGRMTIPVAVDVPQVRLPEVVEATAYFVVSEALTNAAKHAAASRAEVVVTVADDGAVTIVVRDDGCGGAHVGDGGLLGLSDRLAALHGRLVVEGAAGGGTVVTATIPSGG
jgi:signal transduction histidine kinase